MAWCHKATSHCLSQYWPRPMSPYVVTRLQWVKWHGFRNHFVYGSGHKTAAVLLTWFCYQLIAKPGNKTAAVSWPDPYAPSHWDMMLHCNIISHWLGAYTNWSLSLSVIGAWSSYIDRPSQFQVIPGITLLTMIPLQSFSQQLNWKISHDQEDLKITMTKDLRNHQGFIEKYNISGLILGLRPANERWCYFVTMFLIGST